MKITDDIIKAIDRTTKMLGSKSEFARKANISVATLSNYLARTRKSIADDTWDRIYPLIKHYLPKKKSDSNLPDYYKDKNLSSDQRILLDTFSELPKELQEETLIKIIELAKNQLRQRD